MLGGILGGWGLEELQKKAAAVWYLNIPGDPGSVSGLERFPGERNGNSLWDSCLGYPMDRAVWWATLAIPVHGIARARHDLATKLPPSNT